MNNDYETTEMVKLTVKTVAMLGAVFLVGVVFLVIIGWKS
jgi:hypothetical protein